ncbi:hypothetical protein NQZ79_g3240 [Umbelopsis isabellina]|nr:hypothetical protein NQZ79_g3240 [Umbelopsis isabellina]
MFLKANLVRSLLPNTSYHRLCAQKIPRACTPTTSLNKFTSLQNRINHDLRLNSIRKFHTTSPRNVPIIPLPAALLGLLKSGKLVSLVSLSSKTSLTLLPHSIFRQYKLSTKIFASIPLLGIALLLGVGLDKAPNTDRLRLVYLSEEEEAEVVTLEVDQLLGSHSGLIAPKDNEYVQWLQTITNNIARVAVDDIRDPVRKYDIADPNSKQYDVNIICDSSTLNAMCAGNKILIYDLMIEYLEFNTEMMAVIISHEVAHSIQRHFVETHGFASFMLMIGDISRGVFWMLTESLGPYVNQKLNEMIAGFVTMETETTYNRGLEKEADLVGLMLMAKAGYDPRTALTVWSKMAEIDEKTDSEAEASRIAKEKVEAKSEDTMPSVANANLPNKSGQSDNLNVSVKEFVDKLLSSWFGSTHPPSVERLEYMREYLPEAVKVYEQTIAVNGQPHAYQFPQQDSSPQEAPPAYSDSFSRWIARIFGSSRDTNNGVAY